MPRFEVVIPAGGASAVDTTLTLEAPSWVAALRGGLAQAGEPGDTIKHIQVDRQSDGSIQIRHPKSNRVFHLRELEGRDAPLRTVTSQMPAWKPPAAPEPEQAALADSAPPPEQPPPMPVVKKAYSVVIPAAGTRGNDVTLTVEAVNWISAIRLGLARVGEPPDSVKNIMVDRQPDRTIVVTHPKSGRVFRVRELAITEVTGAAAPPPPTATMPPPAEPEAGAAGGAPGPAAVDLEPVPPPAEPAAIAAAPPPAAPETAGPAPAAEPSAATPAAEADAESIPTFPLTEPAEPALAEFDAEEVLAAVFEDTMLLPAMSLGDGIAFALDLALDKIPAEAGHVVVADINQGDLFYGACRGPASRRLIDTRLAMGEGLIGFSIQEGTGLAAAGHEDPDLFQEISKRLGFTVDSLVCSPLEADGRIFGALELINRTGRDRFGEEELNVLSFLASKLAEQFVHTELKESANLKLED